MGKYTGQLFGFILVVLWSLPLIWWILGHFITLPIYPNLWRQDLMYVVQVRLKSYVIKVLIFILRYFNPFIAWGKLDANDTSIRSKIGDILGFGKWRIEKQQFQLCCV